MKVATATLLVLLFSGKILADTRQVVEIRIKTDEALNKMRDPLAAEVQRCLRAVEHELPFLTVSFKPVANAAASIDVLVFQKSSNAFVEISVQRVDGHDITKKQRRIVLLDTSQYLAAVQADDGGKNVTVEENQRKKVTERFVSLLREVRVPVAREIRFNPPPQPTVLFEVPREIVDSWTLSGTVQRTTTVEESGKKKQLDESRTFALLDVKPQQDAQRACAWINGSSDFWNFFTARDIIRDRVYLGPLRNPDEHDPIRNQERQQ